MVASSNCVAVMVPEIQENQLILPEQTEGLTLADYVPVLELYRDINSTLVFDYRDKKGNAAARSHVAKLRKIKAPLGEIHKRLKAEHLAIITKMDADKKDALSIVEEMIEHHDKELRVVAAEEAVEESRLAERARNAKAIEEANQREQAAKDEAARVIAEAEAASKAEEERKRQADEQARADLENIKRVHWLIIPAMVAQGISEEQAKALILAIRDGGIPAVSIDYQWQGVAESEAAKQ